MNILPIQTTQSMGLQVPIGLVMTEMRTSSDQVLVVDGTMNTAFLESRLDLTESTIPDSILKTSIVRQTMLQGYSTLE